MLKTFKRHKLESKLAKTEKKLETTQRIIQFISEYNVPGLRRLLAVALSSASTPEEILRRLERCIAGMYDTRGQFSQYEYDLAFIAKALGGPRLLYAMAHAFGIPATSTLARNAPLPSVHVCLSEPTANDAESAIQTMLDPSVHQPPPKDSVRLAGLTLMLDGVAIEEVCRYDHRRDSVIGLCREHTKDMELRIEDYRTIQILEEALDGKLVHVGKDATVLAVASIADVVHYLPVPVLLSASCKAEVGDGLFRWLRLFLDVWHTHPCGEVLHGPIATVASDGESSFRNARFHLGMSEELDTSTGYGRVLAQCAGLNLRTGPYGLLVTCDTKHIFKRFATLCRGMRGIQVGDTTITSVELAHQLSQLPSLTPAGALDLMDPDDKQDVPRAVELIEALGDIEEQSDTMVTSETAKMEKVAFVAHVLAYFLEPFISGDMSLSEQLKSLSTYAHLTYAMYKKHGLSFLTSPLYVDSHAVVKTIFSTSACLAALNDPELVYLIILEGTDRLENIFSNVRTQDHSRNFDVLQLSQKLSIAAMLTEIFSRYPHLNRGHRRRDLTKRGVDRVSPSDVDHSNKAVVGVDIPKAWNDGRAQANRILQKFLGYTYDLFEHDFAQPSVDMMRPDGIHYVGSSYTETSTSTIPSLSQSPPSPLMDPEASLSPRSYPPSPLESSTTQPLPASHQSVRPDLAPSEIDIVSQLIQQRDVGQFANGLEDHLDTMALTSDSRPLTQVDRRFVYIDKKPFRKDSLIPALLVSESARKATIRTLRAAGITQKKAMRLQQQKVSLGIAESKTSALYSGDLAGTLVRVGDVLCMAVVEILHFERKGDKNSKQLYSVELDDLSSPNVLATCQIVALESGDFLHNSLPDQWVWRSRYLSLNEDAAVVTQDNSLLHIPLSRIHILVPELLENPQLVGHRLSYSRALDHTELESALNDAWDMFDPTSDTYLRDVASIPTVRSTSLPYRDSKGSRFFFLSGIGAVVQTKQKSSTTLLECKLCGQSETLAHMRNHVGKHLLLFLHDYPDAALKVSLSLDACGWCGLPGCHTSLKYGKSKQRNRTIESDCEYFYPQMRYTTAATTTPTQPSTNVPILCTLCQPLKTVWKYEMLAHVIGVHARPDNNSLPALPASLWLDMHISKLEERRMGIEEADIHEYRADNKIPGSDWLENLDDAGHVSDKRYAYNRPASPAVPGMTRPLDRRDSVASSSHRPHKLSKL
ncbi:hypothetical protein CYLTODRAFT_491339 [Cylindrobasidium torrendii FP15055 ss-10]|uniref:Uncharacterized protein n=1 Tax=Cylindrobasidium torrendii FP15055 ss-10 TaxID=1314674 RepID=A0A0D7B7T3_9AGAR|nr:hypothetical protein CYLTODRAFT_491339 [Cylindrobasidium torrendii FP15055 ss-10]